VVLDHLLHEDGLPSPRLATDQHEVAATVELPEAIDDRVDLLVPLEEVHSEKR